MLCGSDVRADQDVLFAHVLDVQKRGLTMEFEVINRPIG